MIWNLLLSISWTILIIIGSAISGNALDQVPILNIPYLDKFIHLFWYYILFIAWYSYLLRYNHQFIKIKYRLYILAINIIFGLIIELLQQCVFIKRSAEFYDLLADLLGSIFAFATFFNVYQSKLFGRYL